MGDAEDNWFMWGDFDVVRGLINEANQWVQAKLSPKAPVLELSDTSTIAYVDPSVVSETTVAVAGPPEGARAMSVETAVATQASISPSPFVSEPVAVHVDDDFDAAPARPGSREVSRESVSHSQQEWMHEDFIAFRETVSPPAKRQRTAEMRTLTRSRSPSVEMVEMRVDLDAPMPSPEEPAGAPEEEEFNYWPYVVFGGVLLVMAFITEDTRTPY